MEEFKERILCYFTFPDRFLKETELRGPEGTFWLAMVTFIHCVITFLVTGGKYWKVFLIPPMLVLTVAVFSFVIFILLKMFVNPKADYCTVYRINCYSYFMTLTIHLAIWLLALLPEKLSFLMILTYFGGLFYGYSLAINAISHRFNIKRSVAFIVFLAAVILCVFLDYENRVGSLLSGFYKVFGMSF